MKARTAGRAAVRATLVLFTPLIVLPCAVHAEELDLAALTELPLERLLEMDVYGASKFSQSISEAPSVATVITADDIRQFGWRTLGEALASVRGLYVTSDRNYDYLGARGFFRPGDYNTRFLLQIDGYRVNDTVYDQAPIGSDFPLDLELVERIEYIPGAGSSVYGSNALFGVINVISKPGASLLGGRASVDVGSAGERRARASYGWENAQGQRFALSASDSRVRGRDLYYREFDKPESNHGLAQGLDYDRVRRLMFKTEAGGLSLSALYAARDKGVPTASFGQVFNDPRSHTLDTQAALKLDYQTALSEKTRLLLRAYAGRHDYLGKYVYDLPPVPAAEDGARARWWGSEIKLVGTGLAGHKLVGGLEYQRDYRSHQYNNEPGAEAPALNDSRQRNRTGVYLQDELSLRDDLLLSAGMRYDMLTGVKPRLSPRTALIWKAGEATTYKAISGASFRAPNVYEMYYAVPGVGGQLANPALKAEHVQSVELAAEHRFSAESRVSASAFRNSVKDLISQQVDANGMLVFRNLDHVRSRGIELEMERIWAGNTRLRASYTWQQSFDQRSGQTPVNSPRHLAKLNLSRRFGAATRLGAEAQYVSSRFTLAGQTGAYWLANANLVHALSPGTELSLSAFNLLGRRYADPASAAHLQDAIARDGRSLRLSLSTRF